MEDYLMEIIKYKTAKLLETIIRRIYRRMIYHAHPFKSSHYYDRWGLLREDLWESYHLQQLQDKTAYWAPPQEILYSWIKENSISIFIIPKGGLFYPLSIDEVGEFCGEGASSYQEAMEDALVISLEKLLLKIKTE